MSNNSNDQLARMKALIKYGTVNEDVKPISTYTLEYKAMAADGKYYGIVKENSKYFVKVATPGKETIAESYQYIGGITNKKNYEYNSYANALKQFELKLGSINEAYDEDRRVVTESLDPFKKEDIIIEGTDKMKNELARQRQIMRNASVIMNEATEIGSTPFKTQPEAEHEHSGDKDYPFTKEGKPEADRGAIKFADGQPEKHSATFGPDSNDVEDYDLDKGDTPKVKDSVASEHPSGGKVARVNESMEECGLSGCFNEEGEDDELGAPVDEPVDTDELDSMEPTELGGEEGDFGEEDAELGDEEDLEGGEEDFEDENEFGDEEDFEDELGDEEDFEDEDEFGDEEDDFDFDDEEDDEFGDDEFDDEGDEFGDEEDLEGGEEDFEDEEDPEIELDENVVKKFRKLVRESIQEMMGDKTYGLEPHGSYQSLDSASDGENNCFDQFGRDANDARFDDALSDLEAEEGEDSDSEIVSDTKKSSGYNPLTDPDNMYKDLYAAHGMYSEEGDLDNEPIGMGGNYDGGEEFFDEPEDDAMYEAKARKMNSIVESVVKDILKEDELHVFGDHPGYRKKPFTLPQTGSDKFQVNRDWNDDSVYSEEPFGKGKGDSTPFDELVAQITDSVMKQINEGKKKVK